VILNVTSSIEQRENYGYGFPATFPKRIIYDRSATLRQKINWKSELVGFRRDVARFSGHVFFINQLNSNLCMGDDRSGLSQLLHRLGTTNLLRHRQPERRLL